MLQITSITRIDGVPLSVKFNNGVTRYYELKTSEWTGTLEEKRIIEKALVVPSTNFTQEI